MTARSNRSERALAAALATFRAGLEQGLPDEALVRSILEAASNIKPECCCGCGTPMRDYAARYVAGHVPLKPLADRLAARLKRTDDGCLEWQGSVNNAGYGRIGLGRQGDGLIATHRAAWQLAKGPIPEGMVVCHSCDNPPCCNVDHLFLGTQDDNIKDMDRKGRRINPAQRLTPEQVREMFALRDGGALQREIAVAYGVSAAYVSEMLAGKYSGKHGAALPEEAAS